MRALFMLQEQELGEERMIWEVRTVKTGTNLPSCGRLYLTSPSDHASPSKNIILADGTETRQGMSDMRG